jgi:tetratricopeptide (TPR) repeat protein
MNCHVTLARGLLLLIVAVCSIIALPPAALAQTSAPAPLPPAAQEALDKGIIAGKVPDYPLAIRFFEDARKLAPDAPVVFLNLGIAESKIAGRELRAIAWFGAYLAASPNAPNAAAVRKEIAVLDVRNLSNVSRLIKSMQEEVTPDNWDFNQDVAGLWAGINDMTSAMAAIALIKNEIGEDGAKQSVSGVQARNGDIAGALKTADLIGFAKYKTEAQVNVAENQIRLGDLAGAKNTLGSALQTAGRVEGDAFKTQALSSIAYAQVRAGDLAGAQSTVASAQKTFELIQEAELRKLVPVADMQTMLADAGPPAAHPASQPAITASDWLGKLDDASEKSDCALNTGPFLDLAGYLKAQPPSDDSRAAFAALRATAETLVTAQNVIHQMLKRQAAR